MARGWGLLKPFLFDILKEVGYLGLDTVKNNLLVLIDCCIEICSHYYILSGSFVPVS